MRNKSCWLAVAALSLALAGCWQKSVYPFYKDKDVTFDPGLQATWSEVGKSPGEEDTWKFTADGDKVYKLVIHTDNAEYPFDVRLFKLGPSQWLDLYSQKRGMSEIPAHHLIRCHREGGTLKLELLSLSWIRGYLTAHPEAIAHLRVNDPENPQDEDKTEMVLTAGVDKLQEFVLKHCGADGFFEKAAEFRKAQ